MAQFIKASTKTHEGQRRFFLILHDYIQVETLILNYSLTNNLVKLAATS